jgi:hypothetical protein
MTTPAIERLELCPNVAERISEALKQCQELIDHFDAKANSSKRSFERLRYATIVLTIGIATIAAVPPVPRWLVAIFSGIAALCTALITATRPQELWLQSRSTQQQLTAERFVFLQRAGDYSDADEDRGVRLFAKRIIDIWSAGHQRWEQGRHQIANQPGAGEGR